MAQHTRKVDVVPCDSDLQQCTRVRCCLQALAAEEAAAAAEQQRLADETARRLQVKAEKSARVAPEVAAGSAEPHASLLFRLPDGTKLSRRFRLLQTVQELFDFLDSEVGAGKQRGGGREFHDSFAGAYWTGTSPNTALNVFSTHQVKGPLRILLTQGCLCCAVQGAGGLWPDTYKLVLQYPRRVLEPSTGAHSLQEAGFEANSHQAVFVEHIE